MTYLRFNASSLPGMVGMDGPDGSRLSDNRSGYISFGPYIRGDPGTYIAGFYIRRTGQMIDQSLILDVLVDGTHELAKLHVPCGELFEDIPKLVYLTFELREPAGSIEVRMYIDASVSIEVQSLVLFRTPPRSWGGQ